MINKIYEMYRSLRRFGNFPTGGGKKLHEAAISYLGTDASPNDYAPDELGCAETINNIVFKAFGDYAGGDLSTYRMYHSIKNNKKFLRVFKPLYGDIVLSPTGFGNGKIVGHVGIVSFGDNILANDSRTGKFMNTYTRESWYNRYSGEGQMPVYFYRRIWS